MSDVEEIFQFYILTRIGDSYLKYDISPHVLG